MGRARGPLTPRREGGQRTSSIPGICGQSGSLRRDLCLSPRRGFSRRGSEGGSPHPPSMSEHPGLRGGRVGLCPHCSTQQRQTFREHAIYKMGRVNAVYLGAVGSTDRTGQGLNPGPRSLASTATAPLVAHGPLLLPRPQNQRLLLAVGSASLCQSTSQGLG